MTSEIPVTQAREELADLINRVAYRRERIVLTRHARPVACIVPPEDLARLEELDERDGKQRAREHEQDGVTYIGAAPADEPTATPAAERLTGAPGPMPLAARHQQPGEPRG